MSNFSKNLKFLIRRFDTTQQELAFYISVSQNSISNWINEVSSPDVGVLVKINQFFGCSLDALVFTDLKSSNLITDDHVKEFKLNGNLKGNRIGNVNPISKGYFVDDHGLKDVVNEPDPVALYGMMGQFKGINDKLDQLRDLGEQILKKGAK